jgi:Trk K+ transport system NAD-binding subunit
MGSFAGGIVAGEPMQFNLTHWLTAVTMAGVGLGLAKEVDVEFSTWGGQFATMIIAVIVLSQLIGPPLFKWAIGHVGEAHTRHEAPHFDGIRDAIIFGIDSQSIALAQQLQQHNWNVRVACLDENLLSTRATNLDVQAVSRFTVDTMRQLGVEQAEAIVGMLSDEENYEIAELAYEHFGTPSVVVRLNERANFRRFHRLGVLVVDPTTAMVGLLDHFVRSPAAASLLVGMEENQDIVDIEVRNRDLDGLTLRELRLPLDTLILSVQRDGHALISHGYTSLRLGDRLTVVGSLEGISELLLRFETQEA